MTPFGKLIKATADAKAKIPQEYHPLIEDVFIAARDIVTLSDQTEKSNRKLASVIWTIHDLLDDFVGAGRRNHE